MRSSWTKQLCSSLPSNLRSPPPPLPEAAPTTLFSDHILSLLSHCNSLSHPDGLTLHTPLLKLGLLSDPLPTNCLLSLHSKCRLPFHALHLFDQIPHPDTVSWTAAISACARSRLDTTALHLFDQMLLTPSTPNNFTLSSVLRSVSSLKQLNLGATLHSRIIKHGYHNNSVLSTALIDLYSNCGRLEESSQVFDSMDYHDIVSWTAMISAFVNSEDNPGALRVYESMLERKVQPNEFTFVKLLSACDSLRCGEMVHAHIITFGTEMNLVLKTALVDMYCKCGCMGVVIDVLSLTPETDVTLWTTVISGYTQAADYHSAIAVFRDMVVSPNAFTYAGVLHACTCLPEPALGRQLHGRVVRSGLDHDASVGNALVDMYTKVSVDANDPIRAFKAIVEPNIVSWTALIAGLVWHRRDKEAVIVFTEMQVTGLQPNSLTFLTIFCCGSLDPGKLHACALKTMSNTWSLTLGNSLADAYSRIGMVEDAWKVAKKMPIRDVCTYTSLAKGLNRIGRYHEALGMIDRMHHEGVAMDGLSLACFLSASAGLVAAGPGKQLHCLAQKSGLLSSVSVSNSLVDLYGKCGSIVEARRVFDAILEPNVVSWNGLISVLASNGHVTESLLVFEDMRMGGMRPDNITFLVVLHACSHGGLVDLGVDYFNSMEESHGVSPQLDHYICLVDMLGRAGRLEAANCVIETMPFQPDALIYKTLLSSCKVQGNMVLGESMARRALDIDPSDPAVYMLLAGIYDDAGKLDWAEQTRQMMKERRVRKWPGRSWMEMSS